MVPSTPDAFAWNGGADICARHSRYQNRVMKGPANGKLRVRPDGRLETSIIGPTSLQGWVSRADKANSEYLYPLSEDPPMWEQDIIRFAERLEIRLPIPHNRRARTYITEHHSICTSMNIASVLDQPSL